jgi:hypothetical protein
MGYTALYPREHNSSLVCVFLKMDNSTLINVIANDTCLPRDLTVPLKEGISVITWGKIFHYLDMETTLDDTSCIFVRCMEILLL